MSARQANQVVSVVRMVKRVRRLVRDLISGAMMRSRASCVLLAMGSGCSVCESKKRFERDRRWMSSDFIGSKIFRSETTFSSP